MAFDYFGKNTIKALLQYIKENIRVPLDEKLDKANPVATGSFSLGRKAGTTVGDGSFAVGKNVTASGEHSISIGYETEAGGSKSIAEGYKTVASGQSAHSEGTVTVAKGNEQHVQGRHNIEDTTSAHIVGNGNGYGEKEKSNAHTLDWSGNAWFAGEVYVGSTSGANKDDGSVKLAKITDIPDVSGKLDKVNPTGSGSVSFGRKSDTKVGVNSVAIGTDVTATNEATVAVGYQVSATGDGAMALGAFTSATNDVAHAEGWGSVATGTTSHAEGEYTIANGRYQHAQGKFNIADGTNAHIVGNGTSSSKRSNAHTLDWDGNAWFSGDVYVGSTSGTNKDDGSVRLAKVTEIPTYTAGTGIAISDTGEVSADTAVLATKAGAEDWTFTLETGETVTKKVVLG